MSASPRYHVLSFGCRVNQADSAAIAEDLENQDFLSTRNPQEADVVVLNTCTITHRSDTDVRKAVRRLERENPQARVVVTGCYAQRDPQALVQLGGIDAVLGQKAKRKLSGVAQSLLEKEKPAEPVLLHTPFSALNLEDIPAVKPTAHMLEDRTRPFLKIQDGCDACCTYCIVPEVRGPAKSASPSDVLTTVRALLARGAFEVVLTGVHLGTYGAHLLPVTSLTNLVQDILSLPGLGRLRLSCIEPMAFPMELAKLAQANKRLAPHFHLPLQSGVDRILKRMVRPYRAADFQRIVERIYALVPNACIGTDVIVGFPGETDQEFEQTSAFVEACGVNYVHVFSYSDRQGTAATKLDGKVEPRIIKNRSQALHGIASRLWSRFLDQQVGRTLPALSLAPPPGGPPSPVHALSDNYCPIRIPDERVAPNHPIGVQITKSHADHLEGTLAPALVETD